MECEWTQQQSVEEHNPFWVPESAEVFFFVLVYIYLHKNLSTLEDQYIDKNIESVACDVEVSIAVRWVLRFLHQKQLGERGLQRGGQIPNRLPQRALFQQCVPSKQGSNKDDGDRDGNHQDLGDKEVRRFGQSASSSKVGGLKLRQGTSPYSHTLVSSHQDKEHVSGQAEGRKWRAVTFQC